MIPEPVIKIRREICARCDAPCAPYLSARLDHADPAASCPRIWSGRWGRYGSVQTPATAPAQSVGLGDAVARIAQPIARALDATLGTKLAGCGGCAARQATLNALIPDIGNHLFRDVAKPVQASGNPTASAP